MCLIRLIIKCIASGKLHADFFAKVNYLDLIISLCLFLIIVLTADVVSEHTLEAFCLITRFKPTSLQLLLHRHVYIHTNTFTMHWPQAILRPLVSSSESVSHMLRFRMLHGNVCLWQVLAPILNKCYVIYI